MIFLLRHIVVRFEAEESNDCWQFDFSPSDLKYLENSNGQKLFIASVTDDKSGALYSEYVEATGEDTLTALKFLFRAMSAKKIAGFPFQGIPKMIYTNNGAFAKSTIFKRVLACLGIELKTHMPRNSDGRRTTSRGKGKVERSNRTLKDSFDQLEKARVITKTQSYIPFEEDNLTLFANKLDARQAIARQFYIYL